MGCGASRKTVQAVYDSEERPRAPSRFLSSPKAEAQEGEADAVFEGTDEEVAAATRIQAAKRGKTARRGVPAPAAGNAEAEEGEAGAVFEGTDEEVAAATRIQAVNRGKTARRGVRWLAQVRCDLKEQRRQTPAPAVGNAEAEEGEAGAVFEGTDEEVAAATRIQAVNRGKTARRGTRATAAAAAARLQYTVEDRVLAIALGLHERCGGESALVHISGDVLGRCVRAVADTVLERMKSDVNDIMRSATAEMEAAEPALCAMDEGLALNGLSKAELNEIKAFSQPNDDLIAVFLACAQLLACSNGRTDIKVRSNGELKDTTWKMCQRVLLRNADHFLRSLHELSNALDADKVPPVNFDHVRPYLEKPWFSRECFTAMSSAAGSVCDFVCNIVVYYDIMRCIRPYRTALGEGNLKLEAAIRSNRERANVENLL